ncbi:Gfo/Idh/MocA family protein [Paenibacillus humicola]|uniref:Gfo/Idh/MocA family protein n=1 Tax=Paenibacillus humicola TaxID=3110540 RepID=UPI00237B7546|nr:Gfo/Idh/MocA family oxidoreductase [Paenibacillus humicola]
MIGYRFMGKAHSHAYRDLPFYFDTPVEPVLQAVAGRSEAEVGRAADKLGWLSWETDWRRLLERPDIDVIDIGAPNHLHAEIAIAAAEAGKHVICEKPLAVSADKAAEMLDAVRKAGVVHMVCHNYRFAPAVQMARKLIAEGRLGTIYHFRGEYLQDWLADPSLPLNWRLRKADSGSGAHGDLMSHVVDLARYLVGEIAEVSGMLHTFVQERPIDGRPGEKGRVDVDDSSSFLAKFACGALGVFEASRFARGNRNGNRFEINGSKGSLRWDMENMNVLQLYLEDDPQGVQGFRTISCTEAVHPLAGSYWPAGHIIGYEHTFINMMAAFMEGLYRGVSPSPNFEDGYRNQLLLEAVERSAASRQWIAVPPY